MKIDSLKAVLGSLNQAGIKYLVAGGVAVNIHGYQRLTHDLDLVLQLQERNVRDAILALARLGYRPTIPVKGEEFADAVKRKQWLEEKHMQVFSLISNEHRETTVDIFVTEPFDFDQEYRSCPEVQLGGDLNVRVVSIPTLIHMKEQAGRDRDKDDIKHLNWIAQEKDNDDREG